MQETLPADENGDVLRGLVARGDDLSLPRDIDFTVVLASEEAAAAFADPLRSRDVRVGVKRTDSAPGLPWDVTVTRHMLPEHAATGQFEDELARLAAPLGGRNDGWGCFEQKRPHERH